MGGHLGTTAKSVRIILLFSKLDGWEGTEAYTPKKKVLFCNLKLHILKKFAAALRAVQL